eukprot:TRINITY_DN1114_c0_g1_i4.p2 TRINITY_DN1114_c0_g1~~TRINITY_DN1114_c0_g1_i4.p2  ORF type:complete len:234 (-),score=41.40 TRINITY_DN1114_c0_g1_i4:126-827(-)
MGDVMGGKPQTPALYPDGQLDYGLMAQTPAFRSGIARLVSGAEKYRICLMCAEKDPLDCHRTLLIAPALKEAGFDLRHLVEGRIESQTETEQRMLQINGGDVPDLFAAAEPLMGDGGTLLTVTYMGSERVVDHYGVMGPVKAALESTTRYMAAELGAKGIRCHAISPGPLLTRAASGIAEFQHLMDETAQRAPSKRLVTIDEIGELAAFLVSDRAKSLTGDVVHIDGGYNIMG